MPSFPRLLPVLLIALLAGSSSLTLQAQDTQGPPRPDQAARTQPARPVDLETLRQLRQDLIEGQQQQQPLIDVVDVSTAGGWINDSPLDRLRELAAQENLTDAEKTVWQQALEQEQAGAERIRGALNRANLAISGIERLQTAQTQVESLIEQTEDYAPDPDRPLSQIEQDISSLNARRTQVNIELNQRRQVLSQLDEQMRNQTATLEQLGRDEEADLTALAALDTSSSEASPEAQAALRAAQERRIQARLIAAQLDALAMPARAARLRLEVRTHETEERWLGQRLTTLQAEFNLRSTEELRALNRGIQELVEREPDFAAQNTEQITQLRQQIDEMERNQVRIRELQEEREQYQRLEVELSQTLTNVEERLEIGGLTETLGGLFLEEQRRLQLLDDRRLALQQIERELSQARLRNITLREQLGLLPEPVEFVISEAPETDLQRLRYDTLNALVTASQTLTDQLRQTEVQLRAMLAVVDQLNQILTETLLWWPSHRPVSLEWVRHVPEAIVAVLSISSWREIQQALLDITWNGPIGFLLTVLLSLGIYRVGRNARPHLKELADKTQHRFTDNIMHTVKALGWTLLRVLPVPVFLSISSWRLQQISSLSPNTQLLAGALISASLWWLAAHFVLLFSARDGIGAVHFDWKPFFVSRLRRNLAWYAPVMFLLIISLALILAHPNDLVFDVFGRIGLVAIGVFSGAFILRVLSVSPEPGAAPIVDRNRRLVRVLMMLLSVAVIVLSLMGYLLTVRELLLRILDTLVVVWIVWLGYRLASRMLLLSEIRLRVRRAREERAKAAAMEASVPIGEGLDIQVTSLSVEDINQQTRTLVKVTTGAVMVLALFWVWAEVLPALTWLDGVTLWSRSIVEGDAEIISSVSLQDILLAIFLTVILTMASRNLPGLVEILLTRATAMDAAARYTATTLLRYFILVIVIVSVFSLMGLRWSELQWMVAALTLGLGFGLQEVVANFVSGLIILFERPIRVGDTITIGEYSGTVGRIRTRATTILDWDNKEIVVPNKAFITERLINWTLTDTVTRITIPVGVSYDSDVDLVIKTLQEIADENQLVLSDPPPNVWFLMFGDSTLNFELRVYVSQLRERLETTSQIHRTIIKRFRELGIEIAFPQMDLHVRDMVPIESRTPPRPARKGSRKPRAEVVEVDEVSDNPNPEVPDDPEPTGQG
ncbi:MAG: mechanosensitive ion channel [Gammaproteobacteria bacterium]|nr:mechanosensitive ion channel [Pseudomonadales bacterium]MCP5347179.1 mechanosensitive ion channel [Pseudomonadales bacterium]